MNALVTGATGFLGSQLVERLRFLGHRVRALVYGPLGGLREGPGIEIFLGDITSLPSALSAVAGIDVVFHSAALVTNWAPWPRFREITVQGTENMLRAARQAHVQRFLHISTIRVYDDRACRRQGTVTEDTPLGARGFRAFGHYARAKVMAEKLVWSFARELPVSVIRPAWIYGPGDVTIMPPIVRYLRSPWARWPSRHDPCADPIFVSDVADCAITAALAPASIGQAYHASPPRRIGLREFLGAVCQALGITPPLGSAPYFVSACAAHAAEWWARLIGSQSPPVLDRAGLAILTEDVRHCSRKAEAELGWTARVGLAQGAAATAAWLHERFPDLRPDPHSLPFEPRSGDSQ